MLNSSIKKKHIFANYGQTDKTRNDNNIFVNYYNYIL